MLFNRGRSGSLAVVCLLVLLVAFALALGGCGSSEEPTAEAEEAEIAVEVQAAERRGLKQIVRVSGELQAARDVFLGAQFGGTVEEVKAQPGDAVSKGDVIVALDDSDARLQVQQGLAGLNAARAGLKQAEEGARPQELAQLEAAVAQARANLDQARADFDRMKTLYAEGAISKQALEQAKMGFTMAESQFEQAQNQLALAEEGAPEAQLDTLRAQVDQARAAYQLASKKLEDMKLTAPFDGVVTQVDAVEGQQLGPGTPVIRVVDMSTLKLDVEVDGSVINSIQPGDSAPVVVPIVAAELEGRIANASPAADPRTKQYAVELELANTGGELKPGMLAEAKLTKQSISDVIVIPYRAVLSRDGINVVFVVEDGKAYEREVTTGIDNGEYIAVVEGLETGEKVVVSGQEFLADGTAVQVGGSTQ